MRICSCGKKIPTWITLDGKERNLRNRKQCLECFPFGSYHKYSRKSEEEKRSYNATKSRNWRKRKMEENGGKDPINIIRVEKKAKIVSALGGKCQICGYSKIFNNLVFHHISDKLFELDSRRFQYALDGLLREIRKCILICHNCHGEVHAGMVLESEINKKHQNVKDYVDSALNEI